MVKRKIIIAEQDNIAAIMEDDRAVEFIINRGDMLLGDVYLATVENILPSIDAAFVNLGGDKMGFLHASDVPGKGDLKKRLEPKQHVVVQIMKEPTGHKGPRVSTNISLPGRFLVMMPESKGISISRKIVELNERARLKSTVSLIKPPGVGVIIRTEALGQKESDVQEDFETLLERWQNIVSMADTTKPPALLYRDQDLLYRVIRESVTEDIKEIVVDSTFGQQRAQQLLQTWNMEKEVKVNLHHGSQPILMSTGVDKEIKQALQTKVPLPSGGYLYIQTTEALSVVDVNSGKFTSLASQAETIKLTNLESCKEIARQLRLRNIGGMIIVDFIDMESRAHQLSVLQAFEKELAPDKSKPQIGQISDLGLVELTRHRQGQALGEIFTKRCKTCHGTGHEIELFSWMRNQETSERGHKPARIKLPSRQGGRLQQVAKPNASLSHKKDKAVFSTSKDVKFARHPNAVNGNNILLSELPNKNTLTKQAALANNTETDSITGLVIAEHFNSLSEKMLGAQFALGQKFSFLPSEINWILSKINPKANDVLALVHSIEASGSVAINLEQPQELSATVSSQADPNNSSQNESIAEDQAGVVPQSQPVTNFSDNPDDKSQPALGIQNPDENSTHKPDASETGASESTSPKVDGSKADGTPPEQQTQTDLEPIVLAGQITEAEQKNTKKPTRSIIAISVDKQERREWLSPELLESKETEENLVQEIEGNALCSDETGTEKVGLSANTMSEEMPVAPTPKRRKTRSRVPRKNSPKR
ncbi:MAG: Rne/Rng family ribonuclease [Cyanobacteria bacterium P01_H01_bin.74]